MKTISPEKCEMTIRRPNGIAETIVLQKITKMNPILWNQAIAANRAAGRGEPLSYKNFDAVVEYEEGDHFTACTRCSGKIDTRTAWSQKEWVRVMGKNIRMDSFYCESCRGRIS